MGTLRCYVFGSPVDSTFVVEVDRDASVSTIRTKLSGLLQQRDPTEISLFKFNNFNAKDDITSYHPMLDPNTPGALKALEKIKSGFNSHSEAVMGFLGDRVIWLSPHLMGLPAKTLFTENVVEKRSSQTLDLLVVAPSWEQRVRQRSGSAATADGTLFGGGAAQNTILYPKASGNRTISMDENAATHLPSYSASGSVAQYPNSQPLHNTTYNYASLQVPVFRNENYPSPPMPVARNENYPGQQPTNQLAPYPMIPPGANVADMGLSKNVTYAAPNVFTSPNEIKLKSSAGDSSAQKKRLVLIALVVVCVVLVVIGIAVAVIFATRKSNSDSNQLQMIQTTLNISGTLVVTSIPVPGAGGSAAGTGIVPIVGPGQTSGNGSGSLNTSTSSGTATTSGGDPNSGTNPNSTTTGQPGPQPGPIQPTGAPQTTTTTATVGPPPVIVTTVTTTTTTTQAPPQTTNTPMFNCERIQIDSFSRKGLNDFGEWANDDNSLPNGFNVANNQLSMQAPTSSSYFYEDMPGQGLGTCNHVLGNTRYLVWAANGVGSMVFSMRAGPNCQAPYNKYNTGRFSISPQWQYYYVDMIAMLGSTEFAQHRMISMDWEGLSSDGSSTWYFKDFFAVNDLSACGISASRIN